MEGQDIPTKIVLEVAPHRMAVVAHVLSIVVLDEEGWRLNPIVVALFFPVAGRARAYRDRLGLGTIQLAGPGEKELSPGSLARRLILPAATEPGVLLAYSAISPSSMAYCLSFIFDAARPCGSPSILALVSARVMMSSGATSWKIAFLRCSESSALSRARARSSSLARTLSPLWGP